MKKNLTLRNQNSTDKLITNLSLKIQNYKKKNILVLVNFSVLITIGLIL